MLRSLRSLRMQLNRGPLGCRCLKPFGQRAGGQGVQPQPGRARVGGNLTTVAADMGGGSRSERGHIRHEGAGSGRVLPRSTPPGPPCG